MSIGLKTSKGTRIKCDCYHHMIEIEACAPYDVDTGEVPEGDEGQIYFGWWERGRGETLWNRISLACRAFWAIMRKGCFTEYEVILRPEIAVWVSKALVEEAYFAQNGCYPEDAFYDGTTSWCGDDNEMCAMRDLRDADD